jgi:hypothetical protein
MPRAFQTRFIIYTAAGFFCLTVLFDLLGMGPSEGGLPPTLFGWMVVVGDAAAETAVFAFLFFVLLHLLGRVFKGLGAGRRV